MIWCTSISGDLDGKIVVEQRLLPHPDVVCWSTDHLALISMSLSGLGLWCTAVPLLLFFNIYRLEDRQSTDSLRRFGYFIQGYEPKFWWWDIFVKRVDIGIMSFVTYTSIAADEKAKLLLFPFVSGCMLAVASWYQPFINTQAEILDFIEMSLLSLRFFLFSMVAILLIFHPPAQTTFSLAILLVLILASGCCYFGFHVLAQLLRHSALERNGAEEEPEMSKKSQRCSGRAEASSEAVRIPSPGGLVLQGLLPLFQASADEKLVVQKLGL